MEAAAAIPEHLRGEFFQAMEDMQMRDQLQLYNRLTQGCFRECVSTFHQKALTKEETKCISNCASKFLNMSKRVGQRFAEINMQQQQEMQAQMSAQQQ